MALDLDAAPRRPSGAAASPPTLHAAPSSPAATRHLGSARVLAVVVVDASARPPASGDLTTTLAALTAQSRRPDVVVGVDASGTDAHLPALSRHLDHVVSTGRADVADGVRAGVAAHDAVALAPRPDPRGPRDPAAPPSVRQWVWLLAAGGAPAPDALARLLDAVEVAPSVAVAGCKHRDGSRLVDAGLSLSRLGRPLTGFDAGDIDQGQLDHREDVLAVGAEGMLVRRDVWDDLGGFDPGLNGAAADLDLCRRAWRAGHRVSVVSGAVHSRAGAAHPGRLDRREIVHLRLAGAPLPLLPLVILAVLVGALGRAVVRVAAKEPVRGLDDVGAVLAALARPDRLWRSRRAAAGCAVRPRRALTPLLAGRREVSRWHRSRWHARRAGSPSASTPRPPRRWRPALAVTAALAALSAVALYRLLGPGEVTGAALAAAPDSLGQLWAAARSSWLPAGLGTAGPPDPFLAVLSGASLAAGGSPALAVTGLLLLALPLAGWGAWLVAGAGTTSVAVRAWAALVWASAPALLVALDDGRLAPLVAHVALPWLVWAVVGAVTARGSRSGWTAAAAAGLALTVVVAAAPVLGAPVLLALVAVGLTFRRSALPLVWTPLPALAVLAPLLAAAADDPRVLVAGPGLSAAVETPPAWAYLLGQTGEGARWPVPGAVLGQDLGGVLALAASGVLLLVVVAALGRADGAGRVAAVRLGWLVVVLGLATALVSSSTPVAAPDVLGWPGAGVSLLVAGLLVAGVAGADGVRARMAPHAFGWRQAGAGLLALLAVVGPLATVGVWTWDSATGAGSVARGVTPALPGVATDGAASADRSRTLVLAPAAGAVSAALVRGDGPGLEDTAAAATARTVAGTGLVADDAPADAATGAIDAAVASLVAGTTDARPQLAALAAGYVLVLPGEGAVPVAAALDGLPGLARAGSVDGALLWRVAPGSGEGRDAPDRAARLRVLGPDGVTALPSGVVAARAQVEPGAPGRLLVLAERADDGWWATLDGRRLEPMVHEGWAQAFVLPENGGAVVVDHRVPGERAWPALAALLLVLTVLLAVPVPTALRRLQGQR